MNRLRWFTDLPDVIRIPLVVVIAAMAFYALHRAMRRKSPRRCPACKKGYAEWTHNATYDGGKEYKVYRCAGCDARLVSERGGALEVQDAWIAKRLPEEATE